MAATVEQINTVQCRVTVEIGSDEVRKAFDQKLRQVRNQARIQGFRPGKAPLPLVQKMYGSYVQAEVSQDLVKEHLWQALEEKGINPIAAPMLEPGDELPNRNQAYKFSAVIDMMPQLKLENYKGLAVESEKWIVPEESLERELKAIRRHHAQTQALPTDVFAQNGHMVILSHSATLAGQKVEAMEVKDLQVVLGETELFPGLEQHILGMKAGEQKNAEVALPADYPDEELAGKAVHFDLKVSALNELIIPELDDEFAKDINFESADMLKERVQQDLLRRAGEMTRQSLEAKILDGLIQRHPFEVPPAMVDQVIDSMIDQMPYQNPEERQHAKADQELRQRFREQAKRRCQNSLILLEISTKEEIKVTEEDVENHVKESLERMGLTGQASTEPSFAQLREQMVKRAREDLVFQKAMDFLIENAQIKEQETKL